MLFSVILLIINLSAVEISALECHALCECVTSIMDCKIPGLEALPLPPSSQLKAVIIANQTFRHSVLDRAALRPYWSPENGGQVRLRLLKIRNCNIVSLASDAFANLGSQLEELDLSGNPLHTIDAQAFAGLRLKSLFLNNLQNPVIHDQAFSGIHEVASLSLQNSHFKLLPLRPLVELVNSHGLKSLSLRGNKISNLAPAFEQVFRPLQSFEISDNPWHCDCKLQWLIQLHKLNRLSKRPGSLTSLNGASGSSDVLQPSCISPIDFAGYTFDEIAMNESETYPGDYNHHLTMARRPTLSCEMPRVEHIEVDLRQPGSVESATATGGLAKIVCQMKGVADSAVSWIFHPEVGQARDVTNLAKQDSGNSISPYPFAPPPPTAQPPRLVTSWLSVKQVAETDMYSCMGHNVLGNTSMTIRIHWPKQKLLSEQEESGVSGAGVVGGGGSKGDNKYMDAELPIQHADYGFLVKRFSLMDVIGAVLGTFLVTMLMFIIAYRSSKLYVYRRAKLRDRSDPMIRHHDGSTKPGGGDGTSSSGAASSLMKFSQLPRYPPEYVPTPVPTSYQHPQPQSAMMLAPKQRDSGTFTSHSTTSSQTANGLGAYETVYNEPTNNPLMYETPGETMAAAAAQQQQPFLFQLAQSQALAAGYPLVFGGTLPPTAAVHSSAYAIGVGNPAIAAAAGAPAPSYIPPPPTGQQPSLPRSVQSQAAGCPPHVYSPAIPLSEVTYHLASNPAVSVQAPVTSATQRQ